MTTLERALARARAAAVQRDDVKSGVLVIRERDIERILTEALATQESAPAVGLRDIPIVSVDGIPSDEIAVVGAGKDGPEVKVRITNVAAPAREVPPVDDAREPWLQRICALLDKYDVSYLGGEHGPSYEAKTDMLSMVRALDAARAERDTAIERAQSFEGSFNAALADSRRAWETANSADTLRDRAEATARKLRDAVAWLRPWALDAVVRARDGVGHTELKREADERLADIRTLLDSPAVKALGRGLLRTTPKGP